MPGTRTQSRDNAGHVAAALRDMLTNYNQLVLDMEVQRLVESSDTLVCWTAPASGTSQIARGSTDTNLATGAFNYTIAGIFAAKAAVAAGTAFGALGTIPQDKWGVIAVDVASGGAISFLSGAANYSTGYATEAAAIAAIPSPVTAKARLGYITIQTKVGTTFVVGTDGLAGGSSGNVANATNYYPVFGTMTPTGNRNFVGGANGILISNVGLSRGSTDTNLANLAFTYNAGGFNNLAKAAVAAGTAFGALGTIPTNTWGLIVAYIDAAGTISFASAARNYSTGYASEQAAQGDLQFIANPAGKCRIGYVTIQTKVGSPFVVGTDALAGGASGNVANATNYYSQTGVIGGLGSTQPYPQGMLASQIGVAGSPQITDLLIENFIAFLPNTGI